MGLIDELLQIVRGASTNNIKELRIRQLVEGSGRYELHLEAPWETVQQICLRLNISESKFRRRWRRRPSGHGKSEVGPAGRFIHCQSDPELDKFLVGTWRLGGITPEQIVGVTIEIAAHGEGKKIKKIEKGKRNK